MEEQCETVILMSNQYLEKYYLDTFVKIKDRRRKKVLSQKVCKANLKKHIAYVTLLYLCFK